MEGVAVLRKVGDVVSRWVLDAVSCGGHLAGFLRRRDR
ncbi:hypothetical protein JOF53_005530 [Crossiella equi]|uniref:Uncharacterized protein n=1 Tax=Crossiella equi TaxID=130796 RepID=A0ABS5AJA9_9PSEU|nr:hypothetical protein [Crossiella equi]